MNAKYFLGALAVSVLLIASCGKKTGGCYKGEKAWVKDFSESDTCGILFRLEDGTYLEPINLSEFNNLPLNHDDLVWISYKPASGASLCGKGDIVEIKCLADREY
jgi:hypothetical protein